MSLNDPLLYTLPIIIEFSRIICDKTKIKTNRLNIIGTAVSILFLEWDVVGDDDDAGGW